MNALGRILSLWFALALLAPGLYAQNLSEAVSLPESITTTGDTTEVRALNEWAEAHRHRYPEQSRQLAERALTLARNLNDQWGIAESLTILGHLAPDIDRKAAYYTTAHETFEQLGDEHALIRSYVHIGNMHGQRGELESALTAYFHALEGFERHGNIQGQASTFTNIGITHATQGNLNEALVYYQRATALAETLEDPITLANVLSNSGFVLARQGSYENAETQLFRALTLSEDIGATLYTAGISSNLGYVFNRQGHHERALTFLLPAERLGKELGENEILIAVYDELGEAYLGLGQYDRALQYANESLSLTQVAGSVADQMAIHLTLSRIYQALGNDGQALTHYRQYAAARDSVFTVEKAEIVTEMQTRYEADEKQRAIERLEQQNQIQALRQTLLIVSVASLLLLLGFLYYRYRVKQRANRLLEELDAAKSRFFANISHEFRTPLTVILGGLQDMIAGRFRQDTEKLAEQQQAMLRNTHQLQRLINEVLDLNRLEAGHLELRPASGDLVRFLKHLVEANAPLAERNGITLTLTCDVESCPRLYDEEKLEKIVGNLLSNALKFTPREGSVRVDLRSRDQIEISVTDDGPGIPSEAREKIFERFTQLDPGVMRGGTGIGLALAKELAELHGGTITLESIPDEGSTFTIRLPLEKTLQPIVEKRVADTFPKQETITPESDGGYVMPALLPWEKEPEDDQPSILIIEDNDDVRAYIRRSLEETYRILEAIDGESGLRRAQETLPDLIVSDVMLPDIDGYEITRQLKAASDTECIPVVMLTARFTENDHVTGYDSGAEAYITKPFSSEALRAAIARLLEERKRLRRRLQATAKQTEQQLYRNGQLALADRVRAAVLENLHDEDFGVDKLASALGMSRHTLNRHVKQEVGLSPSDLIRVLRLEQARELLFKGEGSVSEVAYAVGFKSLSHFTHSFRKHYGQVPSSVLETRD